MATLTQQIAVQTGAIGANTAALATASRQERSGRGDGRRAQAAAPTFGGGGPDVFGMLGSKLAGLFAPLTAAIAPVAILAQTISQTTSGFGPFLKMMGLVTTLLAGLFLPAMVAGAGVVFALAQAIQGPLISAIGELGEVQIPAIIEVAQGLYDSWSTLLDGADALGLKWTDLIGISGSTNEALAAFGLSLRDITKIITGGGVLGIAGGLGGGKGASGTAAGAGGTGASLVGSNPNASPAEREAEKKERGKRRPQTGVGAFTEDIKKGMRLAVESMTREVNGPAQFQSDLASVWKSATLAGLNVDPIQAEQTRIMREQLDALMKLLDKLDARGTQY